MKDSGEPLPDARAAQIRLDRLESADSIRDLAALPGNRFEALAADRSGQFSIRINQQWRICFEWPAGSLGPLSLEKNMPRILIHPGVHLAEELKELGMSAAGLARNLGVPPRRVTAILAGHRGITGDTALRLGHYFGTSAAFWLNLQSLYELRLAEEHVGPEIKRLPKLKHPDLAPA